MFKNYFFLNRFIVEANEVIKNLEITSIFSQEKDRLIIELSGNGIQKFLEISVNPGFPFISLKNEFHRAKKNSVDFFDLAVSQKVISLEIARFDRVIRLNLDDSFIYFVIRGKYTNIIFINNRNFESFKKASTGYLESFPFEMKKLEFSRSFNIPDFGNIPDSNFETKIKNFPFVGKEIVTEVNIKFDKNSTTSKINLLKQILETIRGEKPILILDKETQEIYLSVKGFYVPANSDITEFNNLIDALNYFLGKKYYYETVYRTKKKIEKHLNHELKKVTSKLNDLKARIDNGSKEHEYRKLGDLLLININSISKGSSEIKVQDIYEKDRQIKIKLNPKLFPKQNVDFYFDKAKSEKINYDKSCMLYNDMKEKFDKLVFVEKKFHQSETREDFVQIMKELKIKDQEHSSSKDTLSEKFKHYILQQKYDIYVGKDSKNNDLLTTKFAKQNDYWFHARGLPGSHVILRIENQKVNVPKSVLEKTASLAAFHSKAKTAGVVPVSFALKKYVVKKKGMEPGKVAMLKENVLLVRPEIPPDCEYETK